MIDPRLNDILNRQINMEMAAAYTYYAVAGHFESVSLNGFAAWFRIQRREELVHADKFFQYVLDRGGKVDLAAVAKPKPTYETTIEVFEMALDQERQNTRSICEIYKVAGEITDYQTQSFLTWFLDEQVEEEKTMEDAINMVRTAGDNKSALIVLNEQFGRRTPEV